uniref:CSON008271 protein n=1 Tax=Culicoides sonorensis TaxID=179676 RepID=A0A336M3X5_CULSO
MNLISFKFIFLLVCFALTWNFIVSEFTEDKVYFIQNRRYGEFLYASDTLYDRSRRSIFTWASALNNVCYQRYVSPVLDISDPDYRSKKDEQDSTFNKIKKTETKDLCLWKFDLGNDLNVYQMYSEKPKGNNDLYDSEYLYSPTDGLKYDRNRRRVFTWTEGNCGGGPECDWIIEPVYEDQNKNKFYTIKNRSYGEYLYAGSDDFKINKQTHDGTLHIVYSEKTYVTERQVFTWKYSNDDEVKSDETAHWLIKSV